MITIKVSAEDDSVLFYGCEMKTDNLTKKELKDFYVKLIRDLYHYRSVAEKDKEFWGLEDEETNN